MSATTPAAAPRPLRLELLVNLAGTGWSALVQFACIPVFLAMLGAERYALLAFATTMSLSLKALDLGMSHTANRELAARTASGRTEGARELLRTLETAYVLAGLLLGGALAAGAPLIANRWFGASALGAEAVTTAVRLIGLFIAVQWPLTLYQGALLGLGRATTMNGLAIAASTLAGGGAVVLLFAGHRSLVVVLAWQSLVAAAHTLAVAIATHRALPHDARPARVRIDVLHELRATITGVGGLTLSLLVLTQIDKLLASRWLPLASYGYYMLAATVSNGLGVLSAPLFNTMLPRFSALAAAGDDARLGAEFRRGTRLMVLLVFPAMLTVGVLAFDVVRLWTHDAATAQLVAPIATFLLIGMGSASLLQLAMALQMATGRTSRGIVLHTLLAALLVVLGGVGARYGAAGVAATWASLLAIGALGGGTAIRRQQLGGGGGRWLLVDVLRPLAAMLVVVLVAWPLLRMPLGVPLALVRLAGLGAALTVVVAAASGFTFSMLRGVLSPIPRAS
jgi:O-antigen/teichoic acid export membrane protein